MGCLLARIWVATAAESLDAEGSELFEKKVRPVLVEHCYRCHSSSAKKVKGGLLLDSKDGMLKGGDSGAAIVPGQIEKSRLLEAVGYLNSDLQMPPQGKLPPAQIESLTQWVRIGAPWPNPQLKSSPTTLAEFDLEARRRKHWAWQPIRKPSPPKAKQVGWGRGPIDQFILSRLEQDQLHPSPPADKRTLARRVYFDLIGLPPTPEQVESFVKDESINAYEKMVDMLLASPDFGERWARHWLDLVRYAETLGHEFDYPNPNAWRYRDYVIRALNADVPYNQFVLEHIAGDLLDIPRREQRDGSNESIIGTTFYWLGQRDHSPVDVRQHQSELIDNQIDVLSKTFLGLTVACARCHDHKFDAISSQDYYSLYSVLSSSRYSQAAVNNPAQLAEKQVELMQIKAALRLAVGRAWQVQAIEAAGYLYAAFQVDSSHHKLDAIPGPTVEELSQEFNLDPVRLVQWVEALEEVEGPIAGAVSRTLISPEAELSSFPRGFCDLSASLQGWFKEGESFSESPSSIGDFIVGTSSRPVARIVERPAFDSAIVSRRLQGVLRSPTFTITNRYLHILAAGHGARINVPVDNFTMIRDPIYGGLKRSIDSDRFSWITIDLEMWKGHRAYLELNDTSVADPGDDGHRHGYSLTGYLAVERILFTEEAQPPPCSQAAFSPILGALTSVTSSPDSGVELQQAIRRAVDAWSSPTNHLSSEQASLLNWLLRNDLLDAGASKECVQLVRNFAKIEATLPDPIRVPALVEGTGVDENVFIRGNHRLTGVPAPRGFLRALGEGDPPHFSKGSGRKEIAQLMVDSSNPLVARVMVNRVWLHLFGRGIVATPDDFGVLGQPPSHPELLDWLADWFRSDGRWSTKQLIRLLVTSDTYRMSSRPDDAAAEAKDPLNLLWHRMPLRRLEGEAIRDAILAVSGSLNSARYGPPIPIHLTDFMDGRGRPAVDGPLDGAGRRTVYVEVRRNFISPMMRSFDMPVPFSTVGRRTVSNVPAQSLMLMNDPFVISEARRWAQRALQKAQSPEQRVSEIYLTAFSRLPTSTEVDQSIAFLRWRSEHVGDHRQPSLIAEESWTDLCHVFLNLKEFVFIN